MKNLALALTLLVSGLTHASSIGLSSHPYSNQEKVVTTEFNSFMSNGAGMGMMAKYYQNIDNKMNFDAGIGFASGSRANMITAGFDYELFPDYSTQPRLSLKSLLESTGFDGDRINSLGVAPTLSKGFSFWGKEAFPFVAIPVKLNLNDDEGTYETALSLTTGISGNLPIDGLERLVGNIEANFDLRNSYTALVLGVSVPL